MVLEGNKQFQSISKYVVSFISTCETLTPEQKTELIDSWKTTSGSKLKAIMYKSATKRPKRVVSKYLYFCADERPLILQRNPGMNIKDCTCELGRAWREFMANPDPVRMARYTELFEQDKARFTNETKQLNESRQTAANPPPAKKTSAYLNYCSEMRKIEPKITLKALGVGWAAVKQIPTKLQRYAV